MRGVKRRLIKLIVNIASALSLLLCIASVVLWVRSQFREDTLTWTALEPPGFRQFLINISWDRSVVDIELYVYVYPPVGHRTVVSTGMWSFRSTAVTNNVPRRWWAEHDTQTRIQSSGNADLAPKSEEDWSIGAPFWVPSLTSAILPLLWLGTSIGRRRRRRVGFCPKCGYDLRATPNRCPECGTIPPKMIQESKPHFKVER
jgi:hypothetical protein